MPQRARAGPQPGRRQHVLPPRAAARGRRLQPRARPGRDAAGRLRGDRPLHPRRPALARGGDPLRPGRRGRPRRPRRARGTAPLLPRPLPRRGALEGGPHRAWSAATTASPRSAPTCAARCRSASCAASATPSAATPAASARAAMIVVGLAATTVGLPARSAPASPSPDERRERPPERRRRRAAGADGHPAQPARAGRGRAPRDGGEPADGRRRRRGRGPLHRPRRLDGATSETRDGVRDPHRPRLAARPRLVPRAGALARDGARAAGTSSTSRATTRSSRRWRCCGRSTLRRPLRGHLPRRRPLLGAPQPRSRRRSCGCCGRCCARAARLVAVARFEIEDYGAALGVPPERFALIPNGTDLSFSDADLAGAEPATPTLASIGRLERYKGHHRVLEAFPHVLSASPRRGC